MTGIDYPTPAHVSQLCEFLLLATAGDKDNCACDPEDLVSELRGLRETNSDLTGEKDDESERADKAEKALESCETERDEAKASLETAEANRDAAEATVDTLRSDIRTLEGKIRDLEKWNDDTLLHMAKKEAVAQQQIIASLEETIVSLRATQTRTGNALRLLADALREDGGT